MATMASVQPVDSEIEKGFAPFSISSNKGPDTIHLSPFQSHKNNKSLGPATSHHSLSSARLPPQPSIQEGLATNRISSVSSDTEPHASPVEPQVLEPVENAPAESSPGTGSTSDNTFRRIKEKITRMFRCSSS
ncbi:uncharacterized protein LOC110746297 isoform X2 [Prunus avium]|uniref:Uncharacterized protein LOC110746297 isoform X2 n=1 Tax=Prunus avium TaxID=42229 RepID=A0A6P5RMK3_PRUAV|nr:uncharacterized protein LOC110746297 isoform X2 [Prunus avium]